MILERWHLYGRFVGVVWFDIPNSGALESLLTENGMVFWGVAGRWCLSNVDMRGRCSEHI